MPEGSPWRELLPIAGGEAGLPDEPTIYERIAMRPQRGGEYRSRCGALPSRARIPYNRSCFLPSLPSPEVKVLENLRLMGEGKGEGKRQMQGNGERTSAGVVKAVKAKNVSIV